MPQAPHPLAIVGLGKIARDQHLPALAAGGSFALSASVDPAGGLEGLPAFDSLEELFAALPEVAAVSLCTPPQVRYRLAATALRAGRHVLLEKPPGATLGEVEALAALAADRGLSLFATWHSRFAPAVGRAAEWLASRRLTRVGIVWKEDVRRWHPGQRWIWEPGGLGVFDPGINALSILTLLLPQILQVRAATLEVPENCATPIAGRLELADPDGLPIEVELDFLQEGRQTWDIVFEAGEESMTLHDGGSRLSLEGGAATPAMAGEYQAIYRRFGELIARCESEVDLAPLRLVADACLIGRTVSVPAFRE